VWFVVFFFVRWWGGRAGEAPPHTNLSPSRPHSMEKTIYRTHYLSPSMEIIAQPIHAGWNQSGSGLRLRDRHDIIAATTTTETTAEASFQRAAGRCEAAAGPAPIPLLSCRGRHSTDKTDCERTKRTRCPSAKGAVINDSGPSAPSSAPSADGSTRAGNARYSVCARCTARLRPRRWAWRTKVAPREARASRPSPSFEF